MKEAQFSRGLNPRSNPICRAESQIFQTTLSDFNAAFTETRQVCLWQNAGEEETREPFSLSPPYDVLLSCVCETFRRKEKARKLANVIVTDKWGKRRCWQEGKNVSAQMIKNENVPNKIYSRDFSSLPPPSKSFSRNIFQKSCLQRRDFIIVKRIFCLYGVSSNLCLRLCAAKPFAWGMRQYFQITSVVNLQSSRVTT